MIKFENAREMKSGKNQWKLLNVAKYHKKSQKRKKSVLETGLIAILHAVVSSRFFCLPLSSASVARSFVFLFDFHFQ